MDDDKKLVLEITEDDKGMIYFKSDAGMSVNEVAFCIAAMARALTRDEFIKKPNDFVKLIRKYIVDPLCEEIKEDNNEQKTE